MTSHSRRAITCCAVLGPLCAAAVFAAIAVGPQPIRPAATLHILWRHSLAAVGVRLDAAEPPRWTPYEEVIVWHIRAPRALVGAFVGAGLAFAGTLMQGLFRNPLASPEILGVSSGGAFGAVVCIALGWAARSMWPLPACAFAGSLIAMYIVYALASYQGDTPLATLLLAGIAVAALAGSATSFVIVMSARDGWDVANEIVFWTLGGLDSRRWEHVAMIAAPVGLAVCGAVWFLRDLNLMLLGEEQARTLGVDTARVKLILLALASIATGAAVAVSGLIGFVGLLVPHMLRLLVGPDQRVLVPVSLMGGAVFLTTTDAVMRSVAPAELRLGVVTGALGAPFFLYLLIKNRNKAVHL